MFRCFLGAQSLSVHPSSSRGISTPGGVDHTEQEIHVSSENSKMKSGLSARPRILGTARSSKKEANDDTDIVVMERDQEGV